MFQLTENDYAAYYRPYLEGLPSTDILGYLEEQKSDVLRFLQTIPENLWTHAYAPGKWTIAEVCGHLADSEIIFGYRALAIARGEKQSLPGFDETAYVPAGRFNEMGVQRIIHTWILARELNLDLFYSIREEDWYNLGTANNYTLRAGAIPYVIAGHVRHHMRIIKERYL